MRNFKCMTGLWCVVWVRQSLHMPNRSFRLLSFEKNDSETLYSLIPQKKHSNIHARSKMRFSPRFAIKLNKYVHRTKVLPMICNCGTKFVQMKMYIRSYCYAHIAWYCIFLNFNIWLRENCMVKEKSDNTIVY